MFSRLMTHGVNSRKLRKKMRKELVSLFGSDNVKKCYLQTNGTLFSVIEHGPDDIANIFKFIGNESYEYGIYTDNVVIYTWHHASSKKSSKVIANGIGLEMKKYKVDILAELDQRITNHPNWLRIIRLATAAHDLDNEINEYYQNQCGQDSGLNEVKD